MFVERSKACFLLEGFLCDFFPPVCLTVGCWLSCAFFFFFYFCDFVVVVDLGFHCLFGGFEQKDSPHISVNQWTQWTTIPGK